MGVSNTLPKLGRVHYGTDPTGLKSGRVRPKIRAEIDASVYTSGGLINIKTSVRYTGKSHGM